MKYEYNYTIVIPHKNLPDLLLRCISSIPKRDDVQIIIVDDNSNPDIVNFERFPFVNQKNIEIVLDKSDKRQGHARNIGIDLAKGKWLIFLDADDFFLYSINKALDENIDNDAEIVYFMSTILDSDTYLPYHSQDIWPNNSIKKYISGYENGEHYVRYLYPVPWGKFYKLELVKRRNIRFAEINRLEDVQFSYQCGYYANKIDVKEYSIYCYVKRKGTVTSQIFAGIKYNTIRVYADGLHFFIEKKLTDSPIYQIMEDIVYDNLFEMKRERNLDYYESEKYLLESGISMETINENLKRINKIRIKTRIAQLINRFGWRKK